MDIETVSNNGFDVAVLNGALTVGALASLTPALSTLMQDHPQNTIVIDMSKVTAIDMSAVRLFQNIKKKMDASNRKLFIMNPGKEQSQQLTEASAAGPIPIISSINELQQNVNDNAYQQYVPYTTKEGDFLKLHLSCGVCGSSNVYGYLHNRNDFTWAWPSDDYFPDCLNQKGETYDLFSSLPIICTDCLTTSVEIASFNVLDENNMVKHHSTFNDQVKLLLSKTIKKRKKLLEEVGVTIGDNFFKAPRNRVAALYCYMLADSCSRIAAITYNDVNMFTVGYLNYIALLYCEKAMKPTLIDNCRTFLTQVVATPDRYNHVQLSQAYFIIFISSLSLGKIKDLSKIMESYSSLMEQNGSLKENADNYESPSFWYNRADEIWKQEISNKSSAISL